jgi:hypothetical protein
MTDWIATSTAPTRNKERLGEVEALHEVVRRMCAAPAPGADEHDDAEAEQDHAAEDLDAGRQPRVALLEVDHHAAQPRGEDQNPS